VTGFQLQDVLPLTPLQQGMLFHALYDADGLDVYTAQFVFELEGAVDAGALRAAAGALLRRHANLRVGFLHEGFDEPVQAVAAEVPARFEELDLREAAGTQRAERLESFLAADRARRFDLGEPPLLRFTLVRMGHADWRLVMTNHHILLDGWSMPVLVKELFELYARHGDEGALPRVAPYRDYLAWLARRDRDAATAAWRRSLAGVEGPTLLSGRESHPVATEAPSRTVLELDDELSRALRATALDHGLTLNTLVQCAWGLVLARSTGRRDVLFGTTVSGRPAELPGVEGMVGLFINTVPVRMTQTGPGASLLDVLTAHQERQAALLEHQHTGLTAIQSAAGLGTLFDTLLVFENYPLDAEALRDAQAGLPGGLRVTGVHGFDAAHYPLTITVAPGPKLRLTFSHRDDVFDEESVRPIVERMRLALAAIAEAPEQDAEGVTLLDDAERTSLLARGRGVEAVAVDGSVSDLFERAARAAGPGAVAISGDHGDTTYGQLQERAHALAAALVAAGVGAQDPVAILLERSPAVVAATLGALRADAVYAPFDTRWPAARIQAAAELLNVKAVITDDSTRTHAWISTLPSGTALIELAPTGSITGVQPAAPAARAAALPPTTGGRRLAYAMFTSGSTGAPKAVGVSHADIAALAFDRAWDGGVGEAVLMHSPHAFDASTFEIWTPLLRGGRIVIPPPGALEVGTLRALVGRYGVTAMFLTTALFNALAEQDPAVFAGLRMACAGGEAATPGTMEQVAAACPETAVCHVYGPTEATTFTTLHRVAARQADGAPTQAPPIGRPLDGMRVYVLDSGLNLVPDGVVGELYIAGAGLARGYLHRPELTAARFVADPFTADGTRMYRTGDLARWVGDELECLGRVDRQIKLRGFRIELGEIENNLLAHDEITAACVLLREDRPGDKRLVAYLVSTSGDGGDDHTSPDLPELRAKLAETLPPYMIPSAFVALPQLPLTPNGKVDRRALPIPDSASSRGDDAAAGNAPGNAREDVLCTLFADILDLPHIGIHDNFFDHGGHSLLATRLAGRIRTTLGSDTTIRTIFENPTIHQLARTLDGPRTQRPPLQPATTRPTHIPLSPAQQRLWFLNRLEGPNATYNVPIILDLRGEVDGPALEAALMDLVERHEVLRTVYPEANGRPRQLIVDPDRTDFALRVLDASGEADGVRLAEAVATEPFDVQTDLPIRAALIRVDDEQQILVLVVHHIAADGWSMTPLARDLETAYRARCEGRMPEWTPLPVQYADYTLWQHELLGEDSDPESVVSAQLDYWRNTLGGLPELLELPLDRPRPAVLDHRGGAIAFEVPAELHQALHHLARDTDTSLFMTLQAAVALLLAKHGAGPDIPLGTPVAGRTDPALDDLIGFFVNTLVLRTDLSGNPTTRELLTRIRDHDLTAHTHQDLPFEQLVEHLNPTRTQNHHPLFQVMLTLQNHEEARLDLPGLTARIRPPRTTAAKFDLAFTFAPGQPGQPRKPGQPGQPGAAESAGTLTATIEYATALFEPETVRRLSERLIHLLSEITAKPDAAISSLQAMQVQELHTVLQAGRGPRRALAQETLATLFERQVERTPDAPATHDDAGVSSYRELNARANRLAHHLLACGAGPEQIIALALPRGTDLVTAMLAVAKTGAAYLPLDITHPAQRLARILEDARPVHLITTPHAALPDHRIPTTRLHTDPAADGWPDHNPGTVRHAAHPAYVIYTSGSTGKPKGVAVTHSGISSLLSTQLDRLGVGPGSRVLQFASPGFDAAFWELCMALLSGGCLVLSDPENLMPGPALSALTAERAVTHVTLPPSALAAMHPRTAPLHASTVVLAGEAVPARLIEPWSAGRTLIDAYGPTETTVCATMSLPLRQAPPVVPIGTAVHNADVYVLDRHLRPVPPGALGELYVAGPALARGYLGRPDLTSVRFVADPVANDGTRMYRTGDLARFNGDGHLEYAGRADHQIKLRGHRIEPAEIEHALATRPGVAQAHVMLRADQGREPRLTAYFTTAGSPVDVQALRTELAEILPPYMIPAALVRLPELPLTPNGKIDRKALPAPEAARNGERRAPRTATESTLAAHFAELLHQPGIGVDDDFFAHGGHSLLAVQLTQRIELDFGFRPSLRDVFAAPTPAGLAAIVEQHGDRTEDESGQARADAALDPVVTRIGRGDARTPSGTTRPLLTGATGFLGAFLLRDLIETTGEPVECLVRAGDADGARRRVRAALDEYGLWADRYEPLIVPLAGDLSAPRLGLAADEWSALCRRVGPVFHNGAQVNFARTYRELRGANVEGTKQLLHLMAESDSPGMHFVSTTGVYAPSADLPPVITEASLIGPPEQLVNGYSKSKWAAEEIVRAARERGIPVSVYRPGRISGDSRTGACQEVDLVWQIIKGCIQAQAVPDDNDESTNWIPVDRVSAAITGLALRPDAYETRSPHSFNLTDPGAPSFPKVFDVLRSCGYVLDEVGVDEWRTRIQKDPANAAQLVLGTATAGLANPEEAPAGPVQVHRSYDSTATDGLARALELPRPQVTTDTIRTYIAYFRHTGFLPPAS
jgi:amino acid adenylation domain-containing protein/thioester reductase-like protein